MQEIITKTKCRVCLINEGILSIFEMRNNEYLFNMIKYCTNVKITKNDGFLSSICLNCVDNVILAYKFKRDCETSDKKMRAYFTDKLISEIKICESAELTDSHTNGTIKIERLRNRLIKLGENQNNTPIELKENIIASNNVKKGQRIYIKEKHENLKKIKRKDNVLYECDICFKKFNLKPSFVNHKRRHTNEKRFVCEICSKQFYFNFELRQHNLQHTGEKKFNCDFCDKAFTVMKSLQIHRRTHTGEKPYSCSYCEKKFSNTSSLSLHLKFHTGEKHYSCTFCNQRFSRPSHLKVHTRIHTGEKPYKCEICYKDFRRPGCFKIHMRVHSGEKPFQCSFLNCNKTFTGSGGLLRHEKIHTGIKKFVCEYCDAKYNQSTNLKVHIKKHCKKNPNIRKKN